MKEVVVKLYEFKELSEKAQDKAIELLYDINVDHDWWESTYENAENVGIKITGFDLYRYSITGHFIEGACITAREILGNHGRNCETYKIAKSFLEEWDNLVAEHSDGNDTERVCEEKEDAFDKLADPLESEFLKSILEDYRIILSKEYEYLTSKKEIIETIEANEYFFTEDGKISNL